jgi:hypothetical protein
VELYLHTQYVFMSWSLVKHKDNFIPIQWVTGALSPWGWVKRQGSKVDHSHPSIAEVKNALTYTSTPQYALMAW